MTIYFLEVYISNSYIHTPDLERYKKCTEVTDRHIHTHKDTKWGSVASSLALWWVALTLLVLRTSIISGDRVRSTIPQFDMEMIGHLGSGLANT